MISWPARAMATCAALASLLAVASAAAQPAPSTSAALDRAVEAPVTERMPLQLEVLQGGEAAVPALIEATRLAPPPDAAQEALAAAALRQRIALWALGELGGEPACQAVQAAAPDDEATRVAREIALARCGDPAPLRARVSDGAPGNRLKAGLWLALEGDAAVRDAIFAMQYDEAFDGLRSVAVLALGLLGEEGARPTLETMRSVPELRDHAAIGLLRLGDTSAAIDVRIATENPDPHVRYHALRALTERHVEGTPALLDAASDDLSPRIARYAQREARLWRRRSAPR